VRGSGPGIPLHGGNKERSAEWYKKKLISSIQRSNASERDDKTEYKSDEVEMVQSKSRSGDRNSRFAKKSWKELKEELISENLSKSIKS